MEQQWNPWKFTTIGMLAVLTTALLTGVVVANYVGAQKPHPIALRYSQPAAPVAVRPSAADIDECNRYASTATHDKAREALTDALVGGALGAGLGAAGGAIADGGGGAGKGAGIGGLVGAAAGTLYGVNQVNQNDARAAAAYRACMRRRGYSN